MANALKDLIKSANYQSESPLYSGLITSVGGGGTNFSVVSETEQRGIENGSPYGFVSSPPTGCLGYVLRGSGDEDDVIVGVLDKNRPKSIVTGGGSAMYSIGKGFIICNADGSIDIITPTGKTAKYNGKEIGTSESGITEDRVIELIKQDAVTLFDDGGNNLDELLEARGLTEEGIDLQIDNKLDDFEEYIIGVGDGRYASLEAYTTKIAILNGLIGDINYIVSGERETDEYDEGTLERFVTKTSISEAEINKILYGGESDIPQVWQGDYTPTLENEPASGWTDFSEHENELFIVTGTGENAGYYYTFELLENDEYGWRKLRDDELNGALTGLDKTIRTELTTNYWTAERTDSKITQATGVIDLKVETLREDTESQFVQVQDDIGIIETDLVFHAEALTRNATEIQLLQDEILLKANQTDMVQVISKLDSVETITEQHSAQLEVIPSQIQSTVTSEVSKVKVGSRNLIINSLNLDYNMYYFDDSVGSSVFGTYTIGADYLNT